MTNTHIPFRYDYVGSFLRPESLRKARADYEAGRISRSDLTAAEDAAIRDLVSKQKKAGYPVITDGEFRRATWHLDFMWAFDGVGHSPTKKGLPFHGEEQPQPLFDVTRRGRVPEIRDDGEHVLPLSEGNFVLVVNFIGGQVVILPVTDGFPVEEGAVVRFGADEQSALPARSVERVQKFVIFVFRNGHVCPDPIAHLPYPKSGTPAAFFRGAANLIFCLNFSAFCVIMGL